MRTKLSKKILKNLTQKIKAVADQSQSLRQNLSGGGVDMRDGGRPNKSETVQNFVAKMHMKDKRLLELAVMSVVKSVDVENIMEEEIGETGQIETLQSNLIKDKDTIDTTYLQSIKETHSVTMFGTTESKYDEPIETVLDKTFFLPFKDLHYDDILVKYKKRDGTNVNKNYPVEITAAWMDIGNELVFCVFHPKRNLLFKEVLVRNFTDMERTKPNGDPPASRRYVADASTTSQYDTPLAFGKIFYDTVSAQYVNIIVFNQILQPLGFRNARLEQDEKELAKHKSLLGSSISSLEQSGGLRASIDSQAAKMQNERFAIKAPHNDPEYDGPYQGMAIPAEQLGPEDEDYPEDDPVIMKFLQTLPPPKLDTAGQPRQGQIPDIEKLKKLVTMPEKIKRMEGDEPGNLMFHSPYAGKSSAVFHFDYKFVVGPDGVKKPVETTTGGTARPGENVFRITLIYEFSSYGGEGTETEPIRGTNLHLTPSPFSVRVIYSNVPAQGATDMATRILKLFRSKGGFAADVPNSSLEMNRAFGSGIFGSADVSLDDINATKEYDLNQEIDSVMTRLHKLLIFPDSKYPPREKKLANGKSVPIDISIYLGLLEEHLEQLKSSLPLSLFDLNKLFNPNDPNNVRLPDVSIIPLLQLIYED